MDSESVPTLYSLDILFCSSNHPPGFLSLHWFRRSSSLLVDKLELTKSKRDKALKQILSELNVLLSKYSNENKLTFIIDQKNIIIGRTDLNVTSEILKLIDLKLKKVSLN